MLLKEWENLPPEMQNEDVKEYYDILKKKSLNLFIKRMFDIVVSFIMLVLLSPMFLILAIVIKIDSPGPVFYRQLRVTQYNKKFKIFKFRTMKVNSDKASLLTIDSDTRITRVGKKIRKYRIDEICQLIDVLRGTMSFVGARPEVPKYTEHYSSEMMASLLLPAGVTGLASIYYKDEARLLKDGSNIDRIYIENVLPGKMHYYLSYIKDFSFLNDIKIMFMTVLAIFGKHYTDENLPNISMQVLEKTEIKK